MRTVRLGTAAVVVAFAAMMSGSALPPGSGLGAAYGTVEAPTDGAVVHVSNGTSDPIDVYVNRAAQPTMTDVKALSIGPEFEVKGHDATPYGTYTFSAQPKAAPEAPVIAAVSVNFTPGASFSAILFETPAGGHRFAVYEDDFSATGAGRLTVRNDSRAREVSWRIAPKDVNPQIPYDERQGTLGSGQSQVAIDVTQNDYVLEFLLDGQVVGRHPDVELEHEKNRVLTLVGDPQPTGDPAILRRQVLEQEFQLPPGPAQPDEVTPPADPLTDADLNAPLQFTCEPVELWETNATTATVSAIDPDGVVTNLSLDGVEPAAEGFAVTTATASPAIGEAASAGITVGSDVPPGSYDVSVMANVGSLGEHASCTLPVTVRAITIARLSALAAGFRETGAIDDGFADELLALLERADEQLGEPAVAEACQTLKEAVAAVESEKARRIAVEAGDQFEREAKALRARLGCG